MISSKPLTLAGCGCGARTRTYLKLAAAQPDKFRITAGADPVAARVEAVRGYSGNPDFRGFPSADALLAEPRLADILVIGTQDAYHFEPAMRALELGYDLLLEKPIAPRVEEVLALRHQAERLGRRVMVCYVLRYAPLYREVKALLDAGRIGQVISFNASEGVERWHQAHSFVRGHWHRVEDSSPMIIAKCCHDLDLLPWLLGDSIASVSSFGGLEWFRRAHAPPGAPARCTDGCPAADTCPYFAEHYAGRHRRWLRMVYDNWEEASREEIRDWLSTSAWGRCVYHSDNTAVDHQVLNLSFRSGITGTFTMTAFENGRHLEVYGTEGVLRAGSFYKRAFDADILLEPHGGEAERIVVGAEGAGYQGHGGGDEGLVEDLYLEFTRPRQEMTTSVAAAVHSHVVGFAAEVSRLEGRTVHLDQFQAGLDLDGVTG